MLFQLLANDINDLAADDSDMNNHRRFVDLRGGRASIAGSTHPPISKIPSMSEINYINYINATRLAASNSSSAVQLHRASISCAKSNMYPSCANEAAYMVSMMTNSSREDPNDPISPSLYDLLEKYYQMCKNLI